MATRGTGGLTVIFVVMGMTVGAIAFLLAWGGDELPEGDLPGRSTAPPVQGPGPDAAAADEEPEPAPLVPSIADDPAACLAFLREQASTSPFPAARVAAVEALVATVGLDDAAVASITTGGEEPGEYDEARFAAIREHIKAGSDLGWNQLEGWFRSEDPFWDDDVVAAAAEAAAWLPDERGPNALRRMLVEHEDYVSENLAAVIRGVATTGGGASKEELAGWLANADDEWDADVMGAAAGALLRMGDGAGREVIAVALEDDLEVDPEELVWGLAARGNLAVVPWVAQFLTNPDGFSGEAAAYGLQRIADPSAVPHLEAFRDSEDEDVRDAVAIALASYGDEPSLERVRTLALDSSLHDTRARAWEVLAQRIDPASRSLAKTTLGRPAPGTDRLGTTVIERIHAARLVILLDR